MNNAMTQAEFENDLMTTTERLKITNQQFKDTHAYLTRLDKFNRLLGNKEGWSLTEQDVWRLVQDKLLESLDQLELGSFNLKGGV